MDTHQIPAGTIVVGVDGSGSANEAFSWAVEQAALEQRPLTIVHCVEPVNYLGSGLMAGTTGLDYGRYLHEAHEAGKALLRTSAEQASSRHPELVVHEVLSHSDPRTCLLDLAGTSAMIVIGSRGRGPVASLLLGSVSVSVSKHAECAVVVHRPHGNDGARAGILVGVDGTEGSVAAIEFAYRMASWRAAPLTVLHCYADVSRVPLGSEPTTPDRTSEQALVAEAIAGMQEKFPEVHVSVSLAEGFADKQLISASHSHDLVVVGHRQVAALNDIVYGSVAPNVVEHADGTVAVVPSLAPRRPL